MKPGTGLGDTGGTLPTQETAWFCDSLKSVVSLWDKTNTNGFETALVLQGILIRISWQYLEETSTWKAYHDIKKYLWIAISTLF